MFLKMSLSSRQSEHSAVEHQHAFKVICSINIKSWASMYMLLPLSRVTTRQMKTEDFFFFLELLKNYIHHPIFFLNLLLTYKKNTFDRTYSD